MEGKVPLNYFGGDDNYEKNAQELKRGVYDFLVDDTYMTRKYAGNDILLCFDASYESLLNYSFYHVIANI